MKQKTMILIGAGNRGTFAYASYALECPNEAKFVGVCEPNEEKRNYFKELHNIPAENVYTSWEDILKKEKFADAVIIATQDNLHVEPCLKALEKGYDVLLEKPMADNIKDCLKIQDAVSKSGRTLAICHVLRYTNFFTTLKRLLTEKVIGEVMNIEYSENVAYWHYSHSFVRGPWANEDDSTPFMVAKSCHDMDILSWLIDAKCTNLSSFGSLKFYNRAHQPKDATDRCLDGCPHYTTCPFSVKNIYFRSTPDDGLVPLMRMVSRDLSTTAMLDALKTNQYGRCVFACDNNVTDNQIVNLKFENGVIASFTLSAFTNDNCRRIRVMGSDGEIIGKLEANELEYYKISTKEKFKINIETNASGHSGGDFGIMQNFVRLLNNEGLNLTDSKKSLDSHIMAFAADKACKTNTLINIDEYIEDIRKSM